MLNKKTKILGVIGNPIEHSKSPLIHNCGLRKKHLNYAYYAFKVEHLPNAIVAMKEFGFRGYSVTIPHKVEALSLVDEVDPLAQKIGAINTIVNTKGHLHGYNTDCVGAIHALEEKTKLLKKRVYVIGTGGAARGIIVGLCAKKAHVTIFGRTIAHVHTLAKEFDCEGKALDAIDSEYDILINTTPVGMYPHENELPVPESILKKNSVVFDAVYNPLETLLIKKAKKKGAKTILGVEMFLEQAYEQFRLFTGKEPPKKAMRSILLKELQKEQKKKK